MMKRDTILNSENFAFNKICWTRETLIANDAGMAKIG